MPPLSSQPGSPRPRKGLWFPLLFAVLVLLTLPGAILLGFSLMGQENAANAWLRATLGLSYHNPLPTWGAVLLFLFPPGLILLYFLKLRRKALEVPSTFLWRKSIEDIHVNSLFQWLRDNYLLLVQLCALLLVVYSALAFQLHGRSTTSGKYYILLIDNSASMASTDGEPTRLDAARNQALAEIAARPEGDTGMVIEFNQTASILTPYTRDRSLLRAAVQKITQTARPTRIEDALSLADSLANPQRSADNEAVRPAGENPAEARTYVTPEGISAEVHLYSDGRFPDTPRFAAGNLALVYHRIGESSDNVGIVALNAMRDEKDPSKLQVFARLTSFRASPTEVTVDLEWRQPGQAGFSLLSKKVKLPAFSRETGQGEREEPVLFDLADVAEGGDILLHVRLAGHKDAFPTDDEAWLVVGVVRRGRILIVTPGNSVLHNFFDLDETTRIASVQYLTPEELDDAQKYTRRVRAGEFDLVVFDRCAPPTVETMPLANTWFIAAVPPPFSRQAMPALDKVAIRNTTSTDPLMQHLTGLDEIAFAGAFRFDLRDTRLPPRIPRLLEADRETAVLFVLPRGAFRDVVQTFPLVNDKGEWATNWTLKLSFPLFLRNLLYQLGNVGDASAEENTQPGQVKLLRPGSATPRIEVADPRGRTHSLLRGSGGEFALAQTDVPGIYRATWPGGSRAFAVNLLDADESQITPRSEVRIGEQEVRADQVRLATLDTWKWAALLALGLLVLEWAIYHRRFR